MTSSKLGDFGWRRPHTPDRHHLPAGVRAEGASYSANSSPAHFANVRRSPEFARAGPPLFPPPFQAGGPRHFHGSPNQRPEREVGGHLEERVPPRPSSQPAGLAGPAHADGPPREIIPPFGARPPFGMYGPQDRRDEARPPVTSTYEPNPALRDRPMTVEPLGPSAYSPRKDPRDPLPPRDGPREEMRRDLVGREDPGPFRTGFRHQPYQPRGMVPPPEAPRSHPQMGNPFERPRAGQESIPPQDRAIPSIDPLSRDDRRTSDPHAQLGDAHYRNVMHEHQPLLMQRSRSSIGLEGKRGSRASPMPQAVQGAQMQPTGAGSDPNIKSEFGRIFQGLGSGLGGSMTPSRGSPMPQRQMSGANLEGGGGEAIVLSDGEGMGVMRSGSVSKRGNKRVKEEELNGRYEDDGGRGTPLARGGKRVKAGHGHHHHLHQHNHPHHHHIHGHVHRPEETGGGGGGAGTASAHHHHHIHTSHHHHHSPLVAAAGGVAQQHRTQQPSPPPHIPPIPKPTLTITSQAVLDAVSHLPRRHLGSELYDPSIVLPPAAMASHTYDPAGYFIRYRPGRVWEEKDLNCTVTIRVGRYWLDAVRRENICRNRGVLGTGVYTDDSDPVAVAVHEGWVRGEWGEDVDVEMMGIPTSTTGTEEDVKEEYTARPPAPIIPPEGRDLHLTMLILPALKNYQGSVRFGLKSRDWENETKGGSKGSVHDGLSWTVVGMRWVDEGGSAGTKRGGVARRERIEGLRRESAALALVGLSGGGAGRGTGSAVAVA